MCEATIQVHEFIRMLPKGDRDKELHPCSSFRVLLTSDDEHSVTVFHNDQREPMWESIRGTRDEYFEEAKAFAIELHGVLKGSTLVTKVQTWRRRVERDHFQDLPDVEWEQVNEHALFQAKVTHPD